MQYTELDELGVHNLRITGMMSDGETDTFTTVSDDAFLKVIENTSGSVVAQTQPSPGGLKQLVAFKQRNIIATSDSKGGLHLYNSRGTPERICSLQVESNSEIKGLAVS